jgi:penicillin-binding protein 2
MGKTGTAEVKKHHRAGDEKDLERWNPSNDHAWFAGWAPAEDPEIVIVVMVEHGGGGGAVAAPIAKQILEGYFTKIHPLPPRPTAPTGAAAPAGPVPAARPAPGGAPAGAPGGAR